MKLHSNKILLVVLAVLLAGYAASRLLRTPALESNLPENLLAIDTSKVTEVSIVASGEEVKLIHRDNQWMVQQEQRSATPETSLIKNALGSIEKVVPERIVARREEKWGDYQVDTSGTHVKVLAGGVVLADFWIGKTTGGATCVRMDGDEDVYAVAKSLNSYFNKKFNDWRDKSFLRVPMDSVTQMAFQYPADSGFVLSKVNGRWMSNDVTIDSTKVQTYLNQYRSKKLATFADDFSPSGGPDYMITLSNNSGSLETIRAWRKNDDQWTVTSNYRDGTFFSVTRGQLIDDFFVGRKFFE